LLKEKTRMLTPTLLTIASDDQLIQILRWQLQDHEEGTSRMTVVRSIDEACSLIPRVRPTLVVVHWSRGVRYDEVNQLLWTALAHPIPVLVIADWYRVEQATRLYRMGVTDYIIRSHHQPHFGCVLDAYLRNGPIHSPGSSGPAERHKHSLESPTHSFQAISARVG
jgi:response regulator of citrate/malate metabolism